MRIINATKSHYEYIRKNDHHVLEKLILPKINGNEIFIFTNEEDVPFGWMRHSFFWDNTPFMNMIWIDDAYRK